MTYEYKNDFLYCVIREDEKAGSNSYIYCCGVNVSRFTPLTAGKHRLGQNPAYVGIQNTNLKLRSLLLSKGAEPRTSRGDECQGLIPIKEDQWRTELIFIKNISASDLAEIGEFFVMTLINLVLTAALPDIELPNALPTADELQAYLDELTAKYGDSLRKR
ncbi:hypothetical protein MCHI_000855 [Candidatus Magnetoovum chiemensis]|nr:hypothetical protein MCHI_000855 [Candidatus Magnetoovum chiemensis]